MNAALGGPLDGEAIGRLYERVIDEARRIQRLEAERADARRATARPTSSAEGE